MSCYCILFKTQSSLNSSHLIVSLPSAWGRRSSVELYSLFHHFCISWELLILNWMDMGSFCAYLIAISNNTPDNKNQNHFIPLFFDKRGLLLTQSSEKSLNWIFSWGNWTLQSICLINLKCCRCWNISGMNNCDQINSEFCRKNYDLWCSYIIHMHDKLPYSFILFITDSYLSV